MTSREVTVVAEPHRGGHKPVGSRRTLAVVTRQAASWAGGPAQLVESADLPGQRAEHAQVGDPDPRGHHQGHRHGGGDRAADRSEPPSVRCIRPEPSQAAIQPSNPAAVLGATSSRHPEQRAEPHPVRPQVLALVRASSGRTNASKQTREESASIAIVHSISSGIEGVVRRPAGERALVLGQRAPAPGCASGERPAAPGRPGPGSRRRWSRTPARCGPAARTGGASRAWPADVPTYGTGWIAPMISGTLPEVWPTTRGTGRAATSSPQGSSRRSPPRVSHGAPGRASDRGRDFFAESRDDAHPLLSHLCTASNQEPDPGARARWTSSTPTT